MGYRELADELRNMYRAYVATDNALCRHAKTILAAADAIESLLSGHIFTGFSIAHDPTNPMEKVFVGENLVAESGPGWRINDVLIDGCMRGESHDRVLVVFVRDKEEKTE